MPLPVYLDYNATTPYADEVKAAILSSMNDVWGNPSSSHAIGRKARELVEASRQQVAKMIAASPSEIVFTSGGTESNYTVVENAVKRFRNRNNGETKPHIITTNIEHDSLHLHLQKLTDQGVCEVSFVPVSKETGQVCLDDIEREVKSTTCLITVMTANNETGIIQPIQDIGSFVEKINVEMPQNPILFHTDAAQAIGKIKCSVSDFKVDFLTIAGHKFYGPRTGALYVRNLHKRPKILTPVFYGGGQERCYRPGTENTAMIAGLGQAAELINQNLDTYHADMVDTRNYAEKTLLDTFKDKVVFNNIRQKKCTNVNKLIIEEVPRLPNTISVAFKIDGLSGVSLLGRAKDICASTGAACHSSHGSSSVLVNSGVSTELASCTLRISIGRETTKSDIDKAVKSLLRATK